MTDGYEDDDGEAGTDEDVGGTEVFTRDINLTADLIACIDFRVTPSDSTDDLELNLYNSISGGWTGLERKWKPTLTVENDDNEFIYHYNIVEAYGPGHYRWGLVRSGSTTTFEVKVVHATARDWTVRRPNQNE